MKKLVREGSYQAAHWLFQSSKLDTNERFLIIYLDSHKNAEWVFHPDKICADLSWGRSKYFRVRKSLVDKGILQTKNLRKWDEKRRRKINAGFRASVDLSIAFQYLENLTSVSKSDLSKPTLLRRPTYKRRSQVSGALDGEVVDLEDDGSEH